MKIWANKKNADENG